MAFYQKYRSKTFNEIVGQEHVAQTLLSSIKNNKLVHAYLLAGPRGIGKTSTARLLAKAINCENLQDGEPCNECDSCREITTGRAIDVIEIDAASHTGVDEIREVIEKARLLPTKSKKKVYIIDEVHMLSKSAFNALLKTLEEPPSHVVFILATTEVHKIPATIISRALRFDFRRATKEDIMTNLSRVAEAEKMDVGDDALDLIAVLAAGGHRDALGMLEQLGSIKGHIDAAKAREVMGVAGMDHVYKFVGAIFNNNPEEGLKIAHELYERGMDLAEFNRNVIEILRRVFVYQASNLTAFEDTAENTAEIKKLAGLQSKDRTVELTGYFLESQAMLKDVNFPLLPIEIAVVKACSPQVESGKLKVESIVPEPKIVEKVEKTEKPAEVVEKKSGEKPKEIIENLVDEEQLPVPVVEMTKDIWQSIVDKTKSVNSTLAALLRDAKPAELTTDTLTLAVKFKFHKDRISETKNNQILEKVVCDVTGCKYKVICRIDDMKPKSSTPAEDLEKAVTEVFEV